MDKSIKVMIEEIKKESSKLYDMEDYVLNFIEEVEKRLTKTRETTIYKEDFLTNGWIDYCRECNVPNDCIDITIYFNPDDVNYTKG